MQDTLYNKAVSLTYGYQNYVIMPYYEVNVGQVYYVAVSDGITYDGAYHYPSDTVFYRLQSVTGGAIVSSYHAFYPSGGAYTYNSFNAPAYNSVSDQIHSAPDDVFVGFAIFFVLISYIGSLFLRHKR